MALDHTRVHLAYESGLELDAEYTTDGEVRWIVTAGPPAGSEGWAPLHAVEVTPGMYFCGWIEEAGTTVAQVLDLREQRVTSFVTYLTPDGPQGSIQRGTAQPL